MTLYVRIPRKGERELLVLVVVIAIFPLVSSDAVDPVRNIPSIIDFHRLDPMLPINAASGLGEYARLEFHGPPGFDDLPIDVICTCQ
jgi:hypothetical protein